MIYFYNQSIAVGTTNSVKHFMGSTNGPTPLIANPSLAIFVKGATDDVSVILQAAVVPTPTDQIVTLVDADFIDVKTYAADTVDNIPSLNGMWVRFQVVNSSGSAAPVTCLLE